MLEYYSWYRSDILLLDPDVVCATFCAPTWKTPNGNSSDDDDNDDKTLRIQSLSISLNMMAYHDDISLRPPTASSQMTTLLEFLQDDNGLDRQSTNSSVASSSRLLKRRATTYAPKKAPRSPDDIDFLTLPPFVRRSKSEQIIQGVGHRTKASIASLTSVTENPFTDLASKFQECPESQSAIRQILLAPRSSPSLLSTVPDPFFTVIKSSNRYNTWDLLCYDLKSGLFQNDDQLAEFLAGKRTLNDTTHGSYDPAEQGRQRWEQYQRQCKKEKEEATVTVWAIVTTKRFFLLLAILTITRLYYICLRKYTTDTIILHYNCFRKVYDKTTILAVHTCIMYSSCIHTVSIAYHTSIKSKESTHKDACLGVVYQGDFVTSRQNAIDEV